MRRLALALLLVALTVLPAPAADFVVADPPKPVAVAVADRDGRAHPLAALAGRLTLLHFWASWCGSCREEFPAIDALQRDLAPEGVRVVAVSLDRLGWPVIDRTVERLAIRDVAVYHDTDREAARALGVVGLPTTVIVDATGREVARLIGPGAWGEAAVRDRLRGFAAR